MGRNWPWPATARELNYLPLSWRVPGGGPEEANYGTYLNWTRAACIITRLGCCGLSTVNIKAPVLSEVLAGRFARTATKFREALFDKTEGKTEPSASPDLS